MFKLYTKGIKVGILQGNNIPNITDRVILSTMQSAKDHERIEKFKRRALFNDIGLIVVDECHYIPVNSYDKVFEMLPESKILGFTATPWRTRQLMTSYFDAIGYSLSLGDLVDQGVLLKPVLYEIKFDSCDDQDRIESVVKICEKEKKNSGIIYVNTIAQAEAYRNVLLSFEYKAACITSHTPKNIRDRILLEFREGTTKILVNVNCLTEGIDAPIAEYIVMPYGTKSPTVFQQRIGRVLRTYKEQKEARIYVYGDTPAIAKGTYKKILKATLNDGTSNPLKKDDIFDELEWLEAAEERNTERIEWTRTICETIQLMKGKGIDKFAALLTQKKFPDKYLKDFANFRQYMTNEGPNDRNKISSKQTEILTEKGFKQEHLDTLTVHDASAIISSIISYENRHGEWSVNFGKHKGKHIKELPGAYLGFIASKNPRHPVFILRKKWNQYKKGNDNE
jgi:superfamily II DNA or RNA helicase